jgi:methionine-rich copper-binding protein CopC
MKKIYLLAAAFAGLSFATNAQTSAVVACKKASGEISIVFSVANNCTATPANSRDSLGARTQIGFHSGANGWSAGKDWNATGAVTANRMAGTSGATAKFHVTLANPQTYYGLAAAPTDIELVFNDGPAASPSGANVWRFEGKDQDGAACKNFKFTVASLATCATNTQDLRTSTKAVIAPNPAKQEAQFLFSNPANDVFSLTITNLAGQTVRTYARVTGEMVTIERDNLPSGMYFAVLRSDDGRILTEKFMFE